jgi:hypothetical protein
MWKSRWPSLPESADLVAHKWSGREEELIRRAEQTTQIWLNIKCVYLITFEATDNSVKKNATDVEKQCGFQTRAFPGLGRSNLRLVLLVSAFLI